jgi:putative lipoprotein
MTLSAIFPGFNFMSFAKSKMALLIAASVITGCASEFPIGTAPPASATPESGRIVAYTCEDFSFTTQMWPAAVALRLPDRIETLPRVESGSGQKYQKGALVFWNKGEEAMIETGTQAYSQCHIDAARSAQEEDARFRRISLRAAGNEPGWTMEVVDNQRLIFVGDYGKTKIDLPVPEPSTIGERTLFRAFTDEDKIRVIAERSGCKDVTSGANFDAKVVVRLNDRNYLGCGNFAAWRR